MTTYALSSIRTANKQAGKFFFSQGATQAFHSTYYRTIYQGAGGVYFIVRDIFVSAFDGERTPFWQVVRFDPETAECRQVHGLIETEAEAQRLARVCSQGQ